VTKILHVLTNNPITKLNSWRYK